MSRASFSIRKLIKTSPDDDDDETAFECSSARTIRVQYELEQYQTQHTQKAHLEHKHRSWMSNASTPKTKGHKKVPKPITVVGHTNYGVLNSGSASRRISMPFPFSPHSDRLDPTAPLSARASKEVLTSIHGNGLPRSQNLQHLDVSLRSAKATGDLGSQSSRPLPSDSLGPNGPASAPLDKEKHFLVNDDTRHFPSSGLRSRGQSVSSIRYPSPTPVNTQSNEIPHTPTIIMTSANTAANRSNRSSYVMHGCLQQPSAFVNGQPSPPLEPDEFLQAVVDNREILREMSSVSTLSLDGEDQTWFNEDIGSLSDVSDNVRQLIWETDEAFKAVSSALAEARVASRSPAPSVEDRKAPLQHLQHASQASHEHASMAKHSSPTSPTQIEIISLPPTPSAGRDRDATTSHQDASKAAAFMTTTSDILRSPVNRNFVAKAKKEPKSPKAKAMMSLSHESSPTKPLHGSPPRGPGGHRPHHSYHKSITRLNLAADKVTDKLFEGRAGRFGFLKIEADEVVTPEQLEQFRQNRLAKQSAEAAASRKTSSESLNGVADTVGDESSNDADVEPLHLQDLPSRVGPLGVDVLSPVIEVASPDPFELNKGVMGRLPILAGPGTLDGVTKETKVGQDPLATPPPTPPQHPVDTASTRIPTTPQTANADDESMHLKSPGLSKLSNRRLGHKRSASSNSHIASLPTIPEVKITTPQAWDASRLTQQQGRSSPDQNDNRSSPPCDANGNPFFEEDEEHMFFMSNPVTATMPSFQHGRICLAKADLVNAGTINSLESKLMTSPDETLDWTAFQMAILGGAGDLFSDPDNFLSRDAQEEMVDDLCDWAEDLGFSDADLGALVKSSKPRKATTGSRQHHTPQTAVMSTPGSDTRAYASSYHRKDSTASSSSSLGSGLTRSGDSPDHSIPIAVESEHPSGFWNTYGGAATSASAGSRFHTGPGLKRWTLEGHPKRYQGGPIDVHKANGLPLAGTGKVLPRTPGSAGRKEAGRASIDSLPQSPMLELRTMTGVDGNKEFVSMGYNLNHDLGDFLKWESEHVYASGFYGSE